MGVDHLERDGSLSNNSRQAQGPVHNQTPGGQVNNDDRRVKPVVHTGEVVQGGSGIYPGFELAIGRAFYDLPPPACLRSSL